ncbi:gluconate 2-dehydrogenase subunit 3 family protein [Rhizobium mayense]|uniref:Gluconate 2-dehydrogenase subunit 3 family protein n=1 Tax=Rhizobium mayense TaxID=1312184 RepID=A0ABT7K104_9HYPH|nr:gluconate 2-dehydrogenase subunit 3 family protein [Rhizobium mayense]MDL2401658.1 gluconate 2-dehydrogenase subunit 3 family protein [Rhizobium mayense]
MQDPNICPFRLETFRAILDRIIPADDFPSATENGVDRFILDLCNVGLVAYQDDISRGLAALDERTNDRFEHLSASQQDEILSGLDHEVWFQALCELAAEGYYADPANGANPAAISWEMIGYQPGLPEGPSGPEENPQDAVRGRLWA